MRIILYMFLMVYFPRDIYTFLTHVGKSQLFMCPTCVTSMWYTHSVMVYFPRDTYTFLTHVGESPLSMCPTHVTSMWYTRSLMVYCPRDIYTFLTHVDESSLFMWFARVNCMCCSHTMTRVIHMFYMWNFLLGTNPSLLKFEIHAHGDP